MKVLVTEWYRDWRGTRPQLLRPAALSLDDNKILFALVVSVGNGNYDEVCIESDSVEAKECVKAILCGTGNAKPIALSSAVDRCRLYRGYEIYRQGSAYFFVNPLSRVELFQGYDLNEYVTEFQRP